MTISQYSLTPRQMAEILIRNYDIHEGKWFIGVNFGFSPGYFGPTPRDATPGVIVGLTHILLQRFEDGSPAPAGASEIVVDAALVNPKKS